MADSTTGSKPGWKTTEFYLTLLTQIGTVVAALNGVIPPKIAAVIGAALTGIYAVVRAITKSNVGDSQPTNPVNAVPAK